jgi:hypothetical protein
MTTHSSASSPIDRNSFAELDARARVRSLLDAGSFRELIDPFERVTSPWLARQGVVTQSDDGVVVGKGEIDGQPKDDGVMVHAMGKEAAARVTLRGVEDLERLAAEVPPMAYDIASYATLGLLWKLVDVQSAAQPSASDVAGVRSALVAALDNIRRDSVRDLRSRLGGENRHASSLVRERLRVQW